MKVLRMGSGSISKYKDKDKSQMSHKRTVGYGAYVKWTGPSRRRALVQIRHERCSAHAQETFAGLLLGDI